MFTKLSFSVTSILHRQGQNRGFAPHHDEEREERKIGDAIEGEGADPADRARDDGGD
jgi:hypothetical protein